MGIDTVDIIAEFAPNTVTGAFIPADNNDAGLMGIDTTDILSELAPNTATGTFIPADNEDTGLMGIDSADIITWTSAGSPTGSFIQLEDDAGVLGIDAADIVSTLGTNTATGTFLPADNSDTGVLGTDSADIITWTSAGSPTGSFIQLKDDTGVLGIDANDITTSLDSTYVNVTGDTMTGALTITGGGLQVGTIGSPHDVSIYSQLYVHNGATIGGDLTVDGSLFITNVETIDVSGAFINLNTGPTGAPPASMQSGIIVDRGSLDPYVFLYDESTQAFRVGIAPEAAGPSYDDASTQAVATREDNPVANGIGYWNSALSRIDTDASLTFTGATGLQVDTLVTLTDLASDGAELTGVLINGSNELVTREFGTGAFANIGDFATVAYVDASLVTRDGSITALFDENDAQDTLIANNDTSIAANWTLINTNISDIATNITQIAINDVSIGALETSVQDLSTGKIDAVASTTGAAGHEVYSNEADNVSYIKRLVAGTGATILSDSSTITISVSGAAGYMSKYTDTFSSDGSTSFIVTQATHGITNTDFALTVSVFEGTVQVFPEIDVDGSGDVTITWSSGALSGAGKFIISG